MGFKRKMTVLYSLFTIEQINVELRLVLFIIMITYVVQTLGGANDWLQSPKLEGAGAEGPLVGIGDGGGKLFVSSVVIFARRFRQK